MRIHCEYRGYPTPNVTIWRGWWELANGTGSADFWLKTDDKNDFGEFGCVGENEYGQKNHTIHLEFASKDNYCCLTLLFNSIYEFL